MQILEVILIFLSIFFSISIWSIFIIRKQEKELEKEIFKLKIKLSDREKENELITHDNEALIRTINKKDELYEKLKNKNEESLEYISSLIADFLTLEFDISAKYLETKKHPAIKEAKRIKELKDKTNAIIKYNKLLNYKYEYLFQLFPDLELYVDDIETINELSNLKNIEELDANCDKTCYFLKKEEYETFTEPERNQLALDRYIQQNKTKWQIGRDYELYVGYEYTVKGWNVEYFGIEKQIEDMGRDLIAFNDDEIHIIQCKFWSKQKMIHEKHIAQLYGTTIQYILEQKSTKQVTPIFITNISLSEKAKRFASYLRVKTIENKNISEFPRIKCNINYNEWGDETKIYHLPMDQQYDRTKICKKGEFFAFTVKEAEDAGFRRAWRWFGNG